MHPPFQAQYLLSWGFIIRLVLNNIFPLQTGNLLLFCAAKAMMSDADCLSCSVLHGAYLVLASQVRQLILVATYSDYRLLLRNILFDRVFSLHYWLKRLFVY